jgi:hypothetical protein
MSVRPQLRVVPDRYTTASLAEELRELRKLAKDRRVASLALFRNGKRPPSPRPPKSPRDRTPLAA